MIIFTLFDRFLLCEMSGSSWANSLWCSWLLSDENFLDCLCFKNETVSKTENQQKRKWLFKKRTSKARRRFWMLSWACSDMSSRSRTFRREFEAILPGWSLHQNKNDLKKSKKNKEALEYLRFVVVNNLLVANLVRKATRSTRLGSAHIDWAANDLACALCMYEAMLLMLRRLERMRLKRCMVKNEEVLDWMALKKFDLLVLKLVLAKWLARETFGTIMVVEMASNSSLASFSSPKTSVTSSSLRFLRSSTSSSSSSSSSSSASARVSSMAATLSALSFMVLKSTTLLSSHSSVIDVRNEGCDEDGEGNCRVDWSLLMSPRVAHDFVSCKSSSSWLLTVDIAVVDYVVTAGVVVVFVVVVVQNMDMMMKNVSRIARSHFLVAFRCHFLLANWQLF